MTATKASIEIHAPMKKVYEVISDFEAYPDFLSETKKVVIEEQSGNIIRANFTVSVLKKINYTFKN